MFEHVESYAGDPILTLVEDFLRDPRPNKVNLSIGLFYDEKGRIPLLAPVAKAEDRLVALHEPRSYLPMEGDPTYREEVQKFVFGADHEAVRSGRIATVQTLGGSGGLKLAADFLHRYFPDSQLWISSPTWENHRAIFEGAGITVNEYPYYDLATNRVRFEEMLAAIKTLPRRSIVLLHPCCHNPTGMDLTHDQWKALIPVLAERELIPYLDMAYQGFGEGIDEDAWAVREIATAGISGFVGNSFSKSFSWYGERAGGLSILCASAQEAACVLGQMKATVRRIYSSPPTHGAKIVAMVLGDPALRAEWESEVRGMRERIQEMRSVLESIISAKLPGRDFSYLTAQHGMFSYTGLSEEQVDQLRDEYAIYLVRSGRMCVPGLNRGNVEYVAQAMAQVLA